MRRRGALLALATGALLLTSRGARADEVQDHEGRAATLVQAERYREALAELEAAYSQRKSPRLAYEIGKVHQRLGDAGAAVSFYQSFLAADAGGDGALRRDAEGQVQRLLLLTHPSRRPPLAPEGVRVDFEAYGPGDRYTVSTGEVSCATPCRLYLPPGPRRLGVKGERSFEVELDVVPGPGRVRLETPWTGLLTAGIVTVSASSAMMILGSAALLSSSSSSGPASTTGAVFGWIVGPIAHIVGIGLLAGGVERLRHGNRVRPAALDVAPSAHGATGRLRFAF